MRTNKLFSLINSFNQRQKSQIRELSSSSLLSLNEQSQRLLIVLLEQNSMPDKEKVYKACFNQQKYNDQKFRLLSSQILKALEHYLVIHEISQEEQNVNAELLKLAYYRKRGLHKHYQYKFNSLQKSIQSKNIKATAEQKIQLELEQYEFESVQKRSKVFDFISLIELTEAQFYQSKLRYACLEISHQNIYKSDSRNDMQDFILQVEKSKHVESPSISIYYYGYKMLSEPDKIAHFTEFLKNLDRVESSFEKREVSTLYFLAINFCIRKLNTGQVSFGEQGIKLYEKGLASEVLFINGKLSRFTYKNMAMMAIRTGDYEKAEELSELYEPLILGPEKQSAYHFNMALIRYFKGDLEQSLENIQQAEFKDHLINLSAKTLQAKIYYDLDADKLLDSHLDSMEMYIIRSKVLGYHKTNYKNIISSFKKLVRLNLFDKQATKTFAQKINNLDILSEKKWFLQKLEN